MNVITQSGSPAKENNTLLPKNSALTSCHSTDTHPVLSQHNVSTNDSDPDDEYTIPSDFTDMFAATKKEVQTSFTQGQITYWTITQQVQNCLQYHW